MMPSRNQIISLLFFIAVSICIFAVTLQSCNQNTTQSEKQTQVALSNNEFVGPDACQSCHAKEYTDWTKSDHFKAMMVANDSTVSGDFNNTTFKADGVTSKFFKRDGKFIINTEGDDGKNHDYEIKFTFGYYPLQQYLVEFPGGRMQVPRVSYNVITKKWFHQYSGQTIYHRDWLHWTKQSQNWNSMCASCHSTNLKRNYNEETDSYQTTYSHINVSCESCHGMGKQHVEYINTTDYKVGKKVKGSFLLINKGQTNSEQLSTCIQCHARRTEVAAEIIPSTASLDNFIPIPPTTENYFADGQFRDEDYEFSSFTQSKMYHRGIKCNNCHNPHSGKIIFTGNKLCMQCHETKYDSPQHYFHAENTDAAQCINCHMPTRTYMGADVRRDHSFRIPRPDQSLTYKTPNACTNCHKNKSDKWAADAVVKWYGAKRKYHYSDDLIPGSAGNAYSINHLKNLLDTNSAEMVRATSINYLGEIITEESLNSIKKFLLDSSAIIRNQTINSLSNFPHERWINDVTPMLKDPVRAVRISAANVLSGLPDNAFDKSLIPNFSSANKELLDFLHNQSDFATGNIMLADYYYKTGDNSNAEKYYLRALKIDSIANYARLNLSSIYNAKGQNEKAIATLNEAFKIDPKNPRISYNLALINVEVGNKAEALKYFDLAYKLKYNNDQLYYNYALYQQQSGNNKQAELLFSEGLLKFPDSEKLNFGAAYFFMQGQRNKAENCIRKLKELNPSNPDYQILFRMIR